MRFIVVGSSCLWGGEALQSVEREFGFQTFSLSRHQRYAACNQRAIFSLVFFRQARPRALLRRCLLALFIIFFLA